MKVNQWTMGLAAAGVISFGAVAQAEEKPSHQVLTAVSSTALSGYVSTSLSWTPGSTAATARGLSYRNVGDGFNLDVIDVKLSSALAEGEWASGYNVELWLGPDAGGIGHNLSAGSNIAVKNANVTLNIPVGTGLQAKMGIFDTIVGYESANSIDNPNYSRSRGYSIEPTTHNGLLLSYKVSDGVAVNAGVANTYDAGAINAGQRLNNSQLTYLASASVTAPDSLGFLKGAVLTAGVVDGFRTTDASSAVADNTLVYVGATVPTGIDKLTLGFAYDHLNVDKATTDVDALAAYLSLKTCEKSTLNTRIEYDVAGSGQGTEFLATTITLDYKLWANVVSRLEYRWDHDLNGRAGAANSTRVATAAGNNGTRNNSHSFVAQIAYKF